MTTDFLKYSIIRNAKTKKRAPELKFALFKIVGDSLCVKYKMYESNS